MNQTAVNGLSIAFDDTGPKDMESPAFLLLPGWCTSRSVFRELAAELSKQRRTLTVDWAGHGDSGTPTTDFGASDLVAQAEAVIVASGVARVIPVTISHAGWVALALRQKLGARVAKIALLDWIVSDAPPPFLEVLQGMQSPGWRQAVEMIFGMWLHGVTSERVIRFVKDEMGAYDGSMWARAAREISAAYAREGSPLAAYARLEGEPVPTLHLYAQPDDPGYLAFQQSFSASHPWYRAVKLAVNSHFPLLECPEQMAAELLRFAE